MLEAAAEHKVKVVVLDRPNPIGGIAVEGPMLDAGRESFIAYHALPMRHGMTVGELAKLFVAERKLNVELDVVKCDGWRRGDMFDRTDLAWVNPSPNMRNLTAALLYPGIGLLETTNLSVGRGTERPFEWIGAPWLDGPKLAAALERDRTRWSSFRAREHHADSQCAREEGMRRRSDHRRRLGEIQSTANGLDGGAAHCGICSPTSGTRRTTTACSSIKRVTRRFVPANR